jgi:hypothetical protein
MSVHFNAEFEAEKIETLAKRRLDSKDVDHSLAKALVDEWLSLNKAERNSVIYALTKKHGLPPRDLGSEPNVTKIDRGAGAYEIEFQKGVSDFSDEFPYNSGIFVIGKTVMGVQEKDFATGNQMKIDYLAEFQKNVKR